ncbi:histidinol-phosphate aminotransferase [Tritrichomonas foetus]|uniref:Histidinol-phosphate aminotransferase n=1 Tax=Tritrichomonas foetus TaxID=1144522 RepID=A0A1J4KVZ9_9EUKA|nr:histidinol-phosphate aminotransferase [Tritrichomonas foetus]|eukprot:OHT15314.1 histidinol-phosphate aminotransferase [Tritrichomonas foetus]
MNDPIVSLYQKQGVQCFHGGQSFRSCPNFKCDFSVTTNLSGPPKSGVEAALNAFNEVEHYPDQDAWEARCHFADIMKISPEQILLGNGASEFIDIVPRLYPHGSTWRPGPWGAQFMEYERAAVNAKLVKVPWENEEATLTIMINPNSPTGDYIPFSDFKELISKHDKTTFIIDESFVPCYGPDWFDNSAIRLIEDFGDRVIVISSWTKVLACPLMRIGTVVATKNIIDKIVKLQVPWSVNGLAQAFMIASLHDVDYFTEMWHKTPIWKQNIHDWMNKVGFKVNENSPLWVPYVYVDMLTDEIAKEADKVAFDAGFPIRICASFGKPHNARLGVRLPEHVEKLALSWINNEKLTNMIKAYYDQHPEEKTGINSRKI